MYKYFIHFANKVKEKNYKNMPGWIIAGRGSGINLKELFIDKTKSHIALERYNLPRPDALLVKGIDYEQNKYLIRNFIEKNYSKNYSTFCRLIPLNDDENRPYKHGIKSFSDFENFVKDYDLNNYTINPVEKRDVIYTGSVKSSGDYTLVQMVNGTGEEFFHGLKNPDYSVVIEFPPIIEYKVYPENKAKTEAEKKKEEIENVRARSLIFQAIKYAGGPNNVFPGYYEFEVWSPNDLRFRTFQDIWSKKGFTK